MPKGYVQSQKRLIERHFPCFRCLVKGRLLLCEGVITPSAGCPEYTIRLLAASGHAPSVFVVSPTLLPSRKIHLNADGSLCLYFPPDFRWSDHCNIHETIIPWIAEWLVLYELFLRKGAWLGPEAPHSRSLL